MDFLNWIFGSTPSASEQAAVQREYDAMRDAIARETPEQRTRFYLEVAAQLGNKSAATQLRRLDEIERAQRRHEPR